MRSDVKRKKENEIFAMKMKREKLEYNIVCNFN